MLEPIDPLAFEEYQIPPSIIEESPVFSPPLMPEDINIFLSRFVCEAQLSSSIDDIVTSHKYTLSSASTDSGFGAESEWEEIVTVASLESIEMQRKAMPLEELLQRQDLAVVLEEDIKGADVKVDKWGFVIDETAGESNATLEESKKSKEDEAARAEKWVEVVAKWDTFSSDKKKKMKLKFRKTGIPDRLRGMMWKKLADVASLRDENPSLFKKLLDEQSSFEPQIQRDINRTFPKHIFFREQGGMGQTALFNTLKAYSVYDKRVGYCQGMGFIIALLLLYMTEEDAFYILVRLCRDYEMSGLFEPGFPGLMKFLYMHDQLLEQMLPRLYYHFIDQDIQPTMYAHNWYTTVFSSLPFPYVIRIFDVFLSEGVRVLFRVSLALLKSMQNELLKLDMEGMLTRFKGTAKYLSVTPDEMINIAMSFKIPNRKIERLNREYDMQNPS